MRGGWGCGVEAWEAKRLRRQIRCRFPILKLSQVIWTFKRPTEHLWVGLSPKTWLGEILSLNRSGEREPPTLALLGREPRGRAGWISQKRAQDGKSGDDSDLHFSRQHSCGPAN